MPITRTHLSRVLTGVALVTASTIAAVLPAHAATPATFPPTIAPQVTATYTWSTKSLDVEGRGFSPGGTVDLYFLFGNPPSQIIPGYPWLTLPSVSAGNLLIRVCATPTTCVSMLNPRAGMFSAAEWRWLNCDAPIDVVAFDELSNRWSPVSQVVQQQASGSLC
jgi:hypothetical protein